MNLVISILKSMLNNNVDNAYARIQRLMNKRIIRNEQKGTETGSTIHQINRINETLNKLESYTDEYR